jgi:hypothetical protein
VSDDVHFAPKADLTIRRTFAIAHNAPMSPPASAVPAHIGLPGRGYLTIAISARLQNAKLGARGIEMIDQCEHDEKREPDAQTPGDELLLDRQQRLAVVSA